jgi:2,3-bisphosphoglycerate-dependent phosphoglycerate mutase
MAIELVFEAHSTTTDNEQGHATGWLPGQLSELGRVQARQLGRRRRDDGITAVSSSDLTRAAQTASAAFGASAIPMLYDWRLRECDYGQRNGMPGAELHAGRHEHLDQPYPAAKAGGRPSPVAAGSWPTCHCGGTGSGSSSSVTSPPDGAWTTSSTASR